MARLIGPGIFLILYVVFLAWYDGWGNKPLTPQDVEFYLANVPVGADLDGFRNQLRQMGQDDDGDEFFMLNLNRYRYADSEPQTGVPAAYQDYGSAVIGMILSRASHPLYSGSLPQYSAMGQTAESSWDEVILVRYRSRRDFLDMVTSDEYQAIAPHRTQGIAYAEVSPSTSQINLATPRLFVFVLLAALAVACYRLLGGVRASDA